MPTASETRVPYMIVDSTSRPWSSVPSQYCARPPASHAGGANASCRFSVRRSNGSCGASHGANSAPADAREQDQRRRRAPPANGESSRRGRRSRSRQGARGRRDATCSLAHRLRPETPDRGQRRLAGLRVDAELPVVGLDVERGPHLLPDRPAQVVRRVRVEVQPVVGAQRGEHLGQRHGPVFERDRRELDAVALVVGGVGDEAGQPRRSRRAVVERRHLAAPPALGAREVRRGVAAGVDLLAVAAGPERRVEVDPADAPAVRPVPAHDAAQRAVAPRRPAAAVEQAVGKRVLARRSAPPGTRARRGAAIHAAIFASLSAGGGQVSGSSSGWISAYAALSAIGCAKSRKLRLKSTLSSLTRRPCEKPWGFTAWTKSDRHPRVADGVDEPVVAQQPHLAAGAAVALDAVGGRGQHQQARGVARAQQRDVHRQRLALAAVEVGQRVRLDRELAGARGRVELVPRHPVGLRKLADGIHGQGSLAGPGVRSPRAARFSRARAASGIPRSPRGSRRRAESPRR